MVNLEKTSYLAKQKFSALIFGEEERSRGAVTVRNMADSSQEEVCFGALEAYFNK